MVLRDDRKGIVSLVDAMIFVTILSIVSLAMFSFCMTEYQEEPMAKTVCDDVISIELKASDVLDTNDSDVYRISDLLASATNRNNTIKIENYIRTALNDLIQKMYGYEMRITFGGKSYEFIRDSEGDMLSEYTTNVILINGNIMTYSLIIIK